MPSKVNPEIPIMLDKLRHLRFDINAMVTFEEQTGLNLMDGESWKKLEKGMSVSNFRAFIYACLIHEDKTLTLEKVGGLINAGNMADIAAKIEASKAAAMPEPEENHRPLAKSRSARRRG